MKKTWTVFFSAAVFFNAACQNRDFHQLMGHVSVTQKPTLAEFLYKIMSKNEGKILGGLKASMRGSTALLRHEQENFNLSCEQVQLEKKLAYQCLLNEKPFEISRLSPAFEEGLHALLEQGHKERLFSSHIADGPGLGKREDGYVLRGIDAEVRCEKFDSSKSIKCVYSKAAVIENVLACQGEEQFFTIQKQGELLGTLSLSSKTGPKRLSCEKREKSSTLFECSDNALEPLKILVTENNKKIAAVVTQKTTQNQLLPLYTFNHCDLR